MLISILRSQLASSPLRHRLTYHRHHLEAIVVVCYLVMLVIVLGRMCASRPLWFDELFTLYLARDPLHLWQNLCAGMDNNPPLSYLLSSLCMWVMGDSNFAMRMPAVASALVCVLSIYFFVRRCRGPEEAMLAAATIGITSPIWIYFVEARPYGLLMAITALSFLCWQRYWYGMFAISLILGMLTHYYFVLPVFVLATAELLRWKLQNKFEHRTLISFVLAGMTLLAMAPHWLQTRKHYAQGFWAKVKFSRLSIEDSFHALATKDLTLPLLAALALATLGASVRKRTGTEVRYSPPELIAVIGLALSPLIGVWLGAKVTGAFYYRYAVAATLGWGVLFAFVIGQVSGRTRWVYGLSALIFGLTGMTAQWKAGPDFFHSELAALEQTVSRLDAKARGATVLLASPFEFTRIWHHFPNRQFQPGYLADPEVAYRHNRVDTVERGLQALKPLAGLPLLRFDELITRLNTGATVFFEGPLDHWQANELRALKITLVPTDQPTLFRLIR